MSAPEIKINVVCDKCTPSEERAELPRSGSSYTYDQLDEMAALVSDCIDSEDFIDDMFVAAFIAGLQFGVVREGAETRGMTVEEFARNSYRWCLRHVADLDMRRKIADIFGK